MINLAWWVTRISFVSLRETWIPNSGIKNSPTASVKDDDFALNIKVTSWFIGSIFIYVLYVLCQAYWTWSSYGETRTTAQSAMQADRNTLCSPLFSSSACHPQLNLSSSLWSPNGRYSWRAIREQDMLLEIKEDLESTVSSCRGRHPAEVNLLEKRTRSTLTTKMDCFGLNLCFHYFGAFSGFWKIGY